MKRLPVATLLHLIPLVAMAQAPAMPVARASAESLIRGVFAGDAQARSALEPLARRYTVGVNEGSKEVPAALVGRVALAMALPISPPESIRTARESEWRPAAVRAFRRALVVDSGDAESAGSLEFITAYPYIWLPPQQELAQLRALQRRRGDLDPALLRALIGLELEVGAADSAATLLDTNRSRGLRPALRQHLRAELAFERGDTAAGARAYYAGVEAATDSTDLREYRRDLSWIAAPSELMAWDRLSFATGVRRRWLESFWGRRDLQDGELPGSRLPEHFRRWRIALRNYRWDSDGSVTLGLQDAGFASETFIGNRASVVELMPKPHPRNDVVNRWRAMSRIVDDRGALLIRHGDPVHFPPVVGIGQVTEEHLGWHTPDGLIIVGFSRIRVGSTRFGMVARNHPVGVTEASCHLDGRLCGGGGFLRTEEFIRERETAEHSDNNVRVFPDSLGAVFQVYGIPDGGVLVVVAVPVRGLVAGDSARQAMRRFETVFRILVGDSSTGRSVFSRDTTRRWTFDRPIDRDAWLTGYFEISAPPGMWTTAITASDITNHAGTGVRFPAIEVPTFSDNRLRLSDPILGRTSGNLTWLHDGESIPLNPTNAWRRAEPVIVTFEVNGLAPGRRYDERFEIRRVGSKTIAPDVTVRSTEAATESHRTIQRTLGIQNLEPGDYRLLVAIRDVASNAEVSRERRLAIRK